MNFLSTGVKEVTRRLRRQKNRLALANARKTLDRADTALGRHGWRELADDESVREAFAELQRQDTRIAEADTHIAGIEAKVREHETAREQARAEHAAAVAAIAEERGPFEQKLTDLQARLAEHGKVLHEQNVRRNTLNAEQTALLKQERRTRRQSLLLTEAERAERQGEFDTRRADLAEQAAQLAAARSAAVEPMTADQEAVKEIKTALNALEQREEKARADLAAGERAAAVAIAGLNKDIAVTRRQAGRIENEKDSAYLAIGRRLAARETNSEGADELFNAARRHRQTHERLGALETAWVKESRDANRQDLRIFNFVGVTLTLILAIVLLLVFRSPGKRDWLPANTHAILTLDVRGFTDADFTKALQTRDADAWQGVWTGLLRLVADVPQIDVRKQVARVTRALAPADGHGPAVDCLLVEMRPFVDVDNLVRNRLVGPGGFNSPRIVNGLAIYEKGSIAVAQIGPDTLAVGSRESVEALIRVRLGLREDLKSDAQFFSEFQRLDDNAVFRLVTYRPRELTYLTDTLLNEQLLGNCNALGLTLDMHEPMAAVFILNAPTAVAAAQIARQLQASPDQVLQLQSAGPNLFIEPPTVAKVRDGQIEWRFRMTEPAAKEFMQRVSRLEMAATPGGKVAERAK